MLIDFVAETTGHAHFITDSLYVLRGWDRIRLGRTPPNTNRDLWEALRAAATERHLCVKNIESQMSTEDALRGGWDLRWWVGNFLADTAASSLSTAVQIPQHCVAAVHPLDDIAAATVTRGLRPLCAAWT